MQRGGFLGLFGIVLFSQVFQQLIVGNPRSHKSGEERRSTRLLRLEIRDKARTEEFGIPSRQSEFSCGRSPVGNGSYNFPDDRFCPVFRHKVIGGATEQYAEIRGVRTVVDQQALVLTGRRIKIVGRRECPTVSCQ